MPARTSPRGALGAGLPGALVALVAWAGALLSGGPAEAAGPVITAGHEPYFVRVLTPADGELPPGWVGLGIAPVRDRVTATYGPPGAPAACDVAPICLELVHRAAAAPGDRVAATFAVRVPRADGAAAPLLDGVVARLEAEPAYDPWRVDRSPRGAVGPRAPAAPEALVSAIADPAERERRFRALLAGDPDVAARVRAVEVRDDRVRYTLAGDDGGHVLLELRDRAARQSRPQDVTASFFVTVAGGVPDPPDLVVRAHRALLAADDGSLRLAPWHRLVRGERNALDLTLIALSWLALATLLALLWPALREAARLLGPSRLVWGLILAGVALRLLLPYRMVELGIGFQLTRYADDLVLPRYGAGATALYHAVFQVFGADHVVLVWTNKVLGCFTLPLAAAAGAALFPDARRRLPAFLPAWVAALALTPMILRSDLTESNMVPVFFALWLGLLAWLRWRGPLRVLGAIAGVGLAALARPEMAVVAPLIWLLLGRVREGPRREVLVTAAALTLVAALQLAFVLDVAAREIADASLFVAGRELRLEALLDQLGENALLDPRIAPLAVPLLAAVAVALARPERRLALVVLAGGLAWLYAYAIDHSPASMPRLHIVALIPWSLVAALGVGALFARRRVFGVLASAAWLAAAAATLPTLWAPTNEDTEEILLRDLRASLPSDSPYVLAVISSSDDPPRFPGHHTHRHFPHYRFRDGDRVALGALPRWLGRDAAAPVYYYQGVGCWARIGRDEELDDRGLVEACASIHRHYELEPVWTRLVPNHGNPIHQHLGYYSAADPALEVGLWRVVGAR